MLSVFVREQQKNTIRIEDPDAFWTLIDQMVDAETGLLANRSFLLDAYVRGCLYTVLVPETDEMFERALDRQQLAKLLLCQASWICLPCFCVVCDGQCDMIWVREDLRRMGIGSLMVRSLGVTSTSRQLEGSEQFWRTLHL